MKPEEQDSILSQVPKEMLEGLQSLQEMILANEEMARGLRDHLRDNGWPDHLSDILAAQVLSTLVHRMLMQP